MSWVLVVLTPDLASTVAFINWLLWLEAENSLNPKVAFDQPDSVMILKLRYFQNEFTLLKK